MGVFGDVLGVVFGVALGVVKPSMYLYVNTNRNFFPMDLILCTSLRTYLLCMCQQLGIIFNYYLASDIILRSYIKHAKKTTPSQHKFVFVIQIKDIPKESVMADMTLVNVWLIKVLVKTFHLNPFPDYI